MNTWEKTEIDAGTLKVGVRTKIIFKALVELPLIKSLHASCGCSVPSYSKEKRELIVNYNPNPVPKHLKQQGWYNSRKTITVVYTDGTKDVLSFSAKIKNKENE